MSKEAQLGGLMQLVGNRLGAAQFPLVADQCRILNSLRRHCGASSNTNEGGHWMPTLKAKQYKQGFDMADEYSVLPIKSGLFANEARSDRARLLGLTR